MTGCRARRAIAVLSAGLLAGACGHPTSPRPVGTAPTRAGQAPPGPGATTSQPAVVRSSLLRHNYVRLPVPSADLTNLVRVRGDTLVALVDRGAFDGEVYPVISTDDGGDWVIDGPRFRGDPVRGLLVDGDGTVMAWARDAVRTRRYAAQHWQQTTFEQVHRAWVRGSQLFVQAGGTEYVSIDDGLSWHPLPDAPP